MIDTLRQYGAIEVRRVPIGGTVAIGETMEVCGSHHGAHSACAWRPVLSIADIIEDTASKHRLTPAQIIGRRRRFAAPRMEAMAACVAEGLWSLPQIGRAFGGRDHTTVLHAARRWGVA